MLKDGERLDRLIKEGIDIIQSKSVFSFSLDAVLLADFAKLPKRKNALIIDACSGNGAVAFMMAHKTNAKIYGIEYQEYLADMANRSVQLNHLQHKVQIIHADFKYGDKLFRPDSVDVITCNPPYFSNSEHSRKNQNEAYTLARHEVTITLDDWVRQSSRLLKFGGKLFCVHRPDRVLDIMETMKRYCLLPKRVQFVHPKKNKEANIVLIEAIKNGKSGGMKILPPIIVYDENNNYLDPVRSMLFGEEHNE